MIVESILNGFYSIITFILGLLPNIPDIPSDVQDAVNGFIDLIADTVGLVAFLYTPTILILVFTVLVAIINFDVIYKFALWVYHKVRG